MENGLNIAVILHIHMGDIADFLLDQALFDQDDWLEDAWKRDPIDRKHPSKERGVYWIVAKSDISGHKPKTDRSGKWLIFLPPNVIDSAWQLVADAVHKGKLWDRAKASTLGAIMTKKRDASINQPDMHVICVYTYNADDKDDVMQIREYLRRLGFVQKLPYKLDADTLAGKYAEKGDKKISLYYE